MWQKVYEACSWICPSSNDLTQVHPYTLALSQVVWAVDQSLSILCGTPKDILEPSIETFL